MKKFILLALGLLAFAFAGMDDVNAQVMREDSYSYFWGTDADTLVASDELEIEVRVQGSGTRDINFGLEVTKISGTVTNNFFFAVSMDGVNYSNLDTIPLSDAASGINGLRLDNFNYPYLRITGSSGATAQKASYKLWYINRED